MTTLVNGWIDTHAHFYPPESDGQRLSRRDAMRSAGWQIDAPPVWDPHSTLAYMDRTGIAMQILSNVPKTLAELRASNDYAATLVAEHPQRFGMLAALPTDDTDAALAEVGRSDDLRPDGSASNGSTPDGFAVTARYNDVYLSDPGLGPLWEELDRRRATVFVHPDAYAPASMGRPCVIVEVAFETARTITDMLYRGTFRAYPDIRWVIAHCGGALPALSGRLATLGLESWVPNPAQLTPAELEQHLGRLYLDTAATAPTALGPALQMVGAGHLVYGSDCGVPCTTDATMDRNLAALLRYQGLSEDELTSVGRRALELYPSARRRLEAVPGDTLPVS